MVKVDRLRECFSVFDRNDARFKTEVQILSNMSVDNLAYLSSQQALADLASFRQFIAAKFALTDSNKWVSFGGSYPGKSAFLFSFRNHRHSKTYSILLLRLSFGLVSTQVSAFSTRRSGIVSTHVCNH
jgi:hypothetical protein